jgi:hypothetical protein
MRRVRRVIGRCRASRGRCSGLQTVCDGLANTGDFEPTFRANKVRRGLTFTANKPTFGLLASFGEDGSIAIQDVYLLKNGGSSSMEAMVIRDTLDSLVSRCIPAAPRCLADRRHGHPADDTTFHRISWWSVPGAHGKPPDVRRCRLRNQARVGQVPPPTSTPPWPPWWARR